MHIEHHDVKVVKHFPEQYLVFFADSRAYHHTVHHREVLHRGRVFNFEPRTERRGATESMMEFRVRLRIEGLPVHAWSEEVLAKIVPNCTVHFIESHSRRQDRTRTYDLWAWCANPSKIPKKVLLTIVDPDREQDKGELHQNLLRGYKGAYDYKLHIHLDVVEDLSFNGGSGGDGNRKPWREFLWNYGTPDSQGERRRGQGHDDRYGHDYRPRRDDHDDHDDNFNRGVRCQRSQSSWGRMTRCRGGVDDCYSTNRRRGGNRGYSGRTRALTPPNGEGGHTRKGGQKTTWRKKHTGKKVTFVDPLVQFMGHPSKESRIRDMLATAQGWLPVLSPTRAGRGRERTREGRAADQQQHTAD